MKKADVLVFFKTATAAAKAAGVTVSAVSQWGELIPERHAWRFQFVTAGALRVNPGDYERAAKDVARAQA
jgi:transcriptional repressor of cell division inhibition gene dicB